MKITKDERTYIMNQVNTLIKYNSNFGIILDYSEEIINEFKKTKTYQEDLKPFEPINLRIDTYWYNGNRLALQAYKTQSIKKTDLKNIYTSINCVYLLLDKVFVNSPYGINSIDDVRLMEKVVKAQDLPNKTDKAPVLKQIISELVSELSTAPNYKNEIINYIKKVY